MPPLLPAMLDVFSAEVMPILQRRGLFRTDLRGQTLREHYGLAWPKSVFDEAMPQPLSHFASSAAFERPRGPRALIRPPILWTLRPPTGR